MGLVNSIFSQIGREIGRDIYHGTKNRSNFRQTSPSLSLEIFNFKPSTYEKVSVRKIEELVFKCEDLDFSQLNYEIFLDLDEKIDLLKEVVSEKYIQELETLDKKNFDNLIFFHEMNKKSVENQLLNQTQKVSNLKDVKTFSETLKFIANRKWIFIHMPLFITLFVLWALETTNHGREMATLSIIMYSICFLIPSILLSLLFKRNHNSDNNLEREKLVKLQGLDIKLNSIKF